MSELTNPAVAQPTLETPPPLINPEPRTVIHGLDRLSVAGAAIGQADEQGAGDATPNEQAAGQQVEEPAKTEATALTVEERITQDEELKAYLDRITQSNVSRAITDARTKWDHEVLQKKLQADRQQREEALRELALKAEQGGDEGALALQELGKTVQAQVLKKQSATEFAQAWFQEADQALLTTVGSDPTAMQKLQVTNFGSVSDWVKAIVDHKVAVAVSAEQSDFQKQLDKLSEAKAADMVTARRQNLPNPDTTEPVSGGGGTTRKWNTLAEAAALFSQDEITTNEYALARQWYEDGRLQPGTFLGEF